MIPLIGRETAVSPPNRNQPPLPAPETLADRPKRGRASQRAERQSVAGRLAANRARALTLLVAAARPACSLIDVVRLTGLTRDQVHDAARALAEEDLLVMAFKGNAWRLYATQPPCEESAARLEGIINARGSRAGIADIRSAEV